MRKYLRGINTNIVTAYNSYTQLDMLAIFETQFHIN